MNELLLGFMDWAATHYRTANGEPDGVDRPENYIPYLVTLFEGFADATFAIPADEPKELRAKVFPTTAFG